MNHRCGGDEDNHGPSSSDFNRNPLYHHGFYDDIEVVHQTDKALLIKFNDDEECWVPKKLCKNLTDKSVYIWEGATLKPIPKIDVDDMFDELPDEVVIEKTITNKISNPKNINLKTHYLDGSLREELPF
jgi:hypothetical protein